MLTQLYNLRQPKLTMNIVKCKNCDREMENHAKGYCITCYKKIAWKPRKIICKRCKREMPHHSKGLCPGCYQFVFHLEHNKAWNNKKNYNLTQETYKKITEKCVICGFDKVIDLHHLDENKKNNSNENLIGLCPNHHKMIHDYKYREETFNQLKEKGFNTPKDIKLKFKIN
jgi:ribosomal protein L37E